MVPDLNAQFRHCGERSMGADACNPYDNQKIVPVSGPRQNDPYSENEFKPVCTEYHDQAEELLRTQGKLYKSLPAGRVNQIVRDSRGERATKICSSADFAHLTTWDNASLYMELSGRYPFATVDEAARIVVPVHKSLVGVVLNDMVCVEFPQRSWAALSLFSRRGIRQVPLVLFQSFYRQHQSGMRPS